MNVNPSRRTLLLGLSAALLGTASCGLPRSGPNKREIFAGSVMKQGDAFVVTVNDHVVRATAVQPALGFTSSFIKAGVLGSDTINPGDTLTLTIWENVDDGVMSKKGVPTQLTEVQVDGAGYIFIPYAGRIKAAGNSPDALRKVITEKLDAQTPDPQVAVARTPGDGSTVSVMGAIAGQGVYAIERPTRTLSAMIARAGGVTVKPEVAKITVTRGTKTGTVWLKDLYENPKMDIALRGGDVILVEQDTRSFTSLGATGSQARVPFETQTLSALEAIATVGGLQTGLADPTGVFVFRNEPAEIASVVLGRNDLVGDQRMVYLLDLTGPNGMFLARDFVIRDGDTVYVTEAPYVQWQKSLSAITGSLGPVNSVSNLAGN
ncbi:polysaccharide biosynthesis/export family protein [Sinirhodobacter huangdaonensis]|uniref:Polysaccharide export protein n=1 Tax=Paenirhodobacter huangdaonensis TaxID=2501515 RepID=A0A443LNF9_9RHOB|nr:polysaccharide biosynthesis/export family protein [Sinirhodobacter huangdaonensis]RWR50700.1 polysaccharide export protein [Sinirhodobacter huangdaonensis]